MPKFGMTQETGTVVRWLHREGDTVEQGDPLLEVETDKVVMEVEAPAAGVLAGIRAHEGQVVPVTEVIAVILQPGEAAAEAPAPEAPRATPVAQRIAAEAGVDIAQVPPSVPGGRVTREDVEQYLRSRGPAAQVTAPQPPPPERVAASGRPRATPAARRRAREEGLDLAAIRGSGPQGRVQAADVERAAIERPREAPGMAVAAAPAPRPEAKPLAAPAEGAAEVVPLLGMRRTIAERMTFSYQTAPHVTFTVEADMTAAEALRGELNARAAAEDAPRASLTAILVRVCGWALEQHPLLNASFRDGEILLHREANIGVAVALEDGLIVPVIRNAGRLGLREIARQVQDLTERARQGRLTPDDVAGGTFTVSNLGMFGIKQFTAIINPPQSAILAVGRVAKRAIVLEGPDGDQVVIRPMMHMTLAADHRVVDGAVAARFLRDVVEALEHPGLLLW